MTKLVIAALLLSGCSATLQRRPERVGSSCTTGNGLWTLDAVGVAAGATGVGLGINKEIRGSDSDVPSWTAGIGAVVGLVYAASMHSGIEWSSKCRRQAESAQVASRH